MTNVFGRIPILITKHLINIFQEKKKLVLTYISEFARTFIQPSQKYRKVRKSGNSPTGSIDRQPGRMSELYQFNFYVIHSISTMRWMFG